MLNLSLTLLTGLGMAGGTLATKLSAAQSGQKAILWLVVAVACYISSYALFYKLTTRMEISILSPAMQAISTVGVLVVSTALLHESLGLYKLVGISLICLGLLALGLEHAK